MAQAQRGATDGSLPRPERRRPDARVGRGGRAPPHHRWRRAPASRRRRRGGGGARGEEEGEGSGVGGWVGLRLNRMRGTRPSGGMDGPDSARRVALAPDPPSIWDAQRSRSPPVFFFFFFLLASSLAGNLETPGNGGESGARAPFERRGRGSLFSHRFSLSEF